MTQPKTFDEAFRSMQMNETERQALESDAFAQDGKSGKSGKPPAQGDSKPVDETKPTEIEINETQDAIPPWVTFPQGFRIPPGKEVSFLRFRAKWTDRPDKGERWCMLWPLSDADEKLALKRCRGESLRIMSEMTKGTIRLIDGKRADWTGAGEPETTYSVERFWDEIGSRCRNMINAIYVKTHTLTQSEQDDFLVNCVVIRRATVG